MRWKNFSMANLTSERSNCCDRKHFRDSVDLEDRPVCVVELWVGCTNDTQQNLRYISEVQLLAIAKLLMLLTLANGTPVIAKDIFGSYSSCPLDCGLRFFDGRPLFGESKTIRGIVLSILVTMTVAPLLGISWQIGAVVASLAMAGDLFSSFVKRRLHMLSGDRATGLDQVPESLFPLLACRGPLSLTAAEIAVTVVIFFVGALLVSRLLHKLHLRDRPY